MKWYKKQLEALENKKRGKKKISPESSTSAEKLSAVEVLRAKQRMGTKMVNPIDTRNRSRPKTDLY